ncbi:MULTISPECIES: hypothetical protein [Aphanothece]|uniref:hypothetical protein n=1 Tax=Aphanothece TaxID=1121 RepID=UPI0039855747
MPTLQSTTAFVTIDCPTALKRGHRSLQGTHQPEAGDVIHLASGMDLLVTARYPHAIHTNSLYVFTLTSPLTSAWHGVVAGFIGEKYLFDSCRMLAPALGNQYLSLQESCRDYVQCWKALSDDERQMYLYGATAAVSGVGAVVSGAAFVADLAVGGFPIVQGLTCLASGALCAHSLGEMSQAAQRGAARARELQGHMQWMTTMLLANGYAPDTVLVGPTVNSYCSVVAAGFERVQAYSRRTIRSISMSTASIPGAALAA